GLTKGTQITNNTFAGIYYSIYLQYHDAPLVSGNTLNTVGSTGIEVDASTNGIQIVKNKITSSSASYGIYASGSTGGPGTLGNPPKALIANNFIALSSTGSGIYFYYSTYFNVYSNSINITGASGNSYDVSVYGGSANSISIENNVLSNAGGGMALYIVTP